MLKPKRTRAIFSCDNCNSKKLKCDRGNPCLKCEKLHTSCTYIKANELKHMVTKSSLNLKDTLNQIELIKRQISELEGKLSPPPTSSTATTPEPSYFPKSKIGYNPVEADTDEINFNYGFKKGEPGPLLISHRPFPYLLSMRRDPGAKFMWVYFFKLVQIRPHFYENSANVCALSDSKRAEIIVKAKAKYGAGYIPALGEGRFSRDELKVAITNYGAANGISYAMDTNVLDPMVSYFSLIPPPWVNEKLVDIFFQHVFPHMPVIDENDFRADLERIIPIAEDGTYLFTTPKIESTNDLALLAIHLIVIRLGYMALLNFNDNESCILLKYPITVDTIRATEVIMKEFDLAKRQPLIVLQAGLMLRLYFSFAREHFVTGSEAQISIGSIVQMAYSLGLNRDPICLNIQSGRYQNLRRKIWHYLVRLDVLDSILFGTSLSTNPKTYDAQLPEYHEANSNTRNQDLEKDIINSFHKFQNMLAISYKLAKLHLVVNGKFPVNVVTNLLSRLEVETSVRLLSLEDYLSDDSFSGVLFCRVYMYVKLYCAYNYTCLFYYYQARNSPLQSYYLEKTLLVLLIDLGGLTWAQIQKLEGPGVALMFAPLYYVFIHVTLFSFLVMRSRVLATIYELERDPTLIVRFPGETVESFTALLKELDVELRIFLFHRTKVLINLGEKYISFWLLTSVHANCMKFQNECPEIIPESDPAMIRDAVIGMSPSEIRLLIVLLRKDNSINCVNPGDVWTGSDEDLVQEMQVANLWSQLRKMTTEELVTSSWIDKSQLLSSSRVDLSFDVDNFLQNFGQKFGSQ